MRKTLVSAPNIFFMIIIAALLLTPASPLHAETLTEYKNAIVDYQAKPLDRTKDLYTEVAKLRDVEDGLARQYNIPISRVLNCEMIIEDTIQAYNRIYFLQKQGTSPSEFILDRDNVEDLLSMKPPYSFLFYLDFLEDFQNCINELSRLENIITTANTALNKIAMDIANEEKQFRLCNEKISAGSVNAFNLSWEMREIKARLEQSIAKQTLSSITAAISASDANETREKIHQLKPMLDKIRGNIKFNSDDLTYLNNKISDKNVKLYKTISMLAIKYRSRSEIRSSTSNITKLARFRLSTEQQLIGDEIIILFELVEKWSSLRLTWRRIQDLLEGNLSISEQKDVLSKTNSIIEDINYNIKICIDSIQKIRETEQGTVRRFRNQTGLIAQEEARTRDQLLVNLAARKNRYLSYILDFGEIRGHYLDLQEEALRILNEHDTEQKISLFWRENFSGIGEMELWHIDDSPITVSKFLRAILLFVIGVIITNLLVYFFKKKTASRLKISKHSGLVVQKFLYYIGVITSFMIALSSLHIPMTAFAFLGGALAIALGLGTQKFTGDIFSGIILLFQKKLRIGDVVIIGDKRGIVDEITLQNTVLRCHQSNHLIIPNSKVLDSSIINMSLNNTFTRSEVSISVAYSSDIDKAMELMSNILSEDQDVLKSPPFKILFEDFEQSSIKLTAQFFIDMKESRERDVKSAIRHKILTLFHEAKIEIPFPQTDVHIKNDSKEEDKINK